MPKAIFNLSANAPEAPIEEPDRPLLEPRHFDNYKLTYYNGYAIPQNLENDPVRAEYWRNFKKSKVLEKYGIE